MEVNEEVIGADVEVIASVAISHEISSTIAASSRSDRSAATPMRATALPRLAARSLPPAARRQAAAALPVLARSRAASAFARAAPRRYAAGAGQLNGQQNSAASSSASPPPPSLSAAEAAAARTIAEVARAFEDARDATTETFEPTLDERGVLSLECTAGTYSLEATEGRILLFSPISGPKYYEWDAENAWWYHAADGHQLVELLVREIMHTTGACVNL